MRAYSIIKVGITYALSSIRFSLLCKMSHCEKKEVWNNLEDTIVEIYERRKMDNGKLVVLDNHFTSLFKAHWSFSL